MPLSRISSSRLAHASRALPDDVGAETIEAFGKRANVLEQRLYDPRSRGKDESAAGSDRLDGTMRLAIGREHQSARPNTDRACAEDEQGEALRAEENRRSVRDGV